MPTAWPSAYSQGYAEGLTVGVELPRATRCASQGRTLPEGYAVGVGCALCRGLCRRHRICPDFFLICSSPFAQQNSMKFTQKYQDHQVHHIGLPNHQIHLHTIIKIMVHHQVEVQVQVDTHMSTK